MLSDLCYQCWQIFVTNAVRSLSPMLSDLCYQCWSEHCHQCCQIFVTNAVRSLFPMLVRALSPMLSDLCYQCWPVLYHQCWTYLCRQCWPDICHQCWTYKCIFVINAGQILAINAGYDFVTNTGQNIVTNDGQFFVLFAGQKYVLTYYGLCFISHSCFSYLNDFNYFARIIISESCRTRSEQGENGPFEMGCRCFHLFSIDFQLFYFLTRIIPGNSCCFIGCCQIIILEITTEDIINRINIWD